MWIMTGLVGETVWKVNCAPDCALAEYTLLAIVVGGIVDETANLSGKQNGPKY